MLTNIKEISLLKTKIESGKTISKMDLDKTIKIISSYNIKIGAV